MYAGGEAEARGFEEGMRTLGARAGINFDFDVPAHWQPVESQRLLKWAGEQGMQEPLMEVFNRNHFTLRKSASSRASLLEAVEEAGLDRAEAAAFLATDRYEAEVWRSYGDTIRKHGIHAIPYMVFNGPSTKGGPFRANGVGSGEVVVNGSSSPEEFYAILTRIVQMECPAKPQAP